MADNNTEESSPVDKQDNIDEISKTSSPYLGIEDMMMIDLDDTSMASTTYSDKTEKVGITLPNSLIKRTDELRGDVPRSMYIRRTIIYYLKQGKTR